MGFYLPGNFLGEIGWAIIALIPIAMKIAVFILAILFLVKGIKYFNAKNSETDKERYKADANADLDEIEKELSALREDWNDTRR